MFSKFLSTDVLREIRREVTRKNAEARMKIFAQADLVNAQTPFHKVPVSLPANLPDVKNMIDTPGC
jgi:hypothetical protein